MEINWFSKVLLLLSAFAFPSGSRARCIVTIFEASFIAVEEQYFSCPFRSILTVSEPGARDNSGKGHVQVWLCSILVLIVWIVSLLILQFLFTLNLLSFANDSWWIGQIL